MALGRALGVLVLCQGLALPVWATDTLDCEAPQGADGGPAGISLLLGASPVLAVVRAALTVGDKTWSTAEDATNRLSVGQAFRDGERLLIDLIDPESLESVAAIRLYEVSERDMAVVAGILKVAGKGAWALTCIGP